MQVSVVRFRPWAPSLLPAADFRQHQDFPRHGRDNACLLVTRRVLDVFGRCAIVRAKPKEVLT
jgi:hypothetical protein